MATQGCGHATGGGHFRIFAHGDRGFRISLLPGPERIVGARAAFTSDIAVIGGPKKEIHMAKNARSCTVFLLVAIAASLPGCAEEPLDAKAAESNGPGATGAGDTSPEQARSVRGIHECLKLWEAGNQDEAVALLLQLYDERMASGPLRILDMTEARFVEHTLAQRDAMQKQMLADIKVFKQLVGETLRRAEADARAKNGQEARRKLDAVDFLGRANSGEEVPLLVNLVGEWTIKKAKAARQSF